MSQNLNTINFSTPFLIGVPNSRISPEWIRTLGNIIATVNQNQVTTSDEFQTLIATSRTPANYSQMLDALQAAQQINTNLKSIVRQLQIKFDELDAQMPRGRTAASSSVRINISDDTSSNVTLYPAMSTGLNGAQALRTSSSKWTYNPSTGALTATQLVATNGFGCNGASPQTAVSSGGALAAYGAGANGFDTAAHAQALYTMVVQIRAALVSNGIMS